MGTIEKEIVQAVLDHSGEKNESFSAELKL